MIIITFRSQEEGQHIFLLLLTIWFVCLCLCLIYVMAKPDEYSKTFVDHDLSKEDVVISNGRNIYLRCLLIQHISILAYKNSCYMVHWLGIALANANRQCSLKLLVRPFFNPPQIVTKPNEPILFILISKCHCLVCANAIQQFTCKTINFSSCINFDKSIYHI